MDYAQLDESSAWAYAHFGILMGGFEIKLKREEPLIPYGLFCLYN